MRERGPPNLQAKMAVTRASSSPRTRSRTSASASSSASSSTSTPHSRRMRSGNSGALEVKHAVLYPRTVALGFRGTKEQKKRALHCQLRATLELFSPHPPPEKHLPWNHQGHSLGEPRMNTGGKSRDDSVAGSWVQVVRSIHSFTSSINEHPICSV